jgi:hypothetical protein
VIKDLNMDNATELSVTPAAPPSSAPSEALDAVKVSEETFGLLKSFDILLSDLLRRLGGLEESYLTSKTKLLEELTFQRRQFDAALNDAAQKHGLDTKQQRWVFNFQTRTFTRED